ncbi:chondroadherin-like [Palaemon carinicauda]|uniref:chondroadherin-like n=1 Tax=Palaemon carinicauda TaxID=392227 RepID=UPI0035B69A3A
MTQFREQQCGIMTPMRKPFIVFILMVMAAVATSAAPHWMEGGCPPSDQIKPCLCQDFFDLYITCHNLTDKRLLEITKTIRAKKPQVMAMKITDSDLQDIPDGSFSGLQIEQLAIVNSKVSSVGGKAFADLGSSLRELVLDNNELTHIPTDALSDLQGLEILHLRTNKIQRLPNYGFSKLEKLQELRLEDNDINVVDSMAFGDCCRNLDILDLTRNLLTEIPTVSFFTLTNLTYLKLDGNKIEEIGKDAFSGLTKLNTLDLANNQIATVEENAFRKLQIRNLDLQQNKLEGLTELSFAGLENVTKWIDLSYNNFTAIPTQTLTNFRYLRHLDLSYNEISLLEDNSFSGFGHHLRYIELNNNKLQSISLDALQDLESVQFLMLAHNNLTRLPRIIVNPVIDSLFMLDLSDNPLICDCDLQWLKQWLDSVNPLDRIISDPICFMEGTKHLQFVRHLDCAQEVGQAPYEQLQNCKGLACVQSLAAFFAGHIRWY